jgi:predicted Zn-dependent peptidase
MEFRRLLFGKDHPYSNHFTTEDFDKVTPHLVREFYRKRLSASDCRIMLSGRIDETVLDEVARHFSAFDRHPLPEDTPIPFSPAPPGHYRIEKADTVQSSIRIGKNGIQLLNEEYTAFQLLNTVLGGYFGSRLMSNIREEKGFTYGINSFNVNLPLGAYWSIATDVNSTQMKAALAEIEKEIRRLQQEPVPEKELDLVKSFYYGELLRELDGVFAQADALKHKLNYHTDNTFYLDMMEKIRQCTSEELMLLARKHLNIEELYTVIAGRFPKRGGTTQKTGRPQK